MGRASAASEGERRTAPAASRPGRGIVVVSWGSTALFALSVAGDRAGIGALELAAVVSALGLFVAGVVVWVAAFARALARSRRDEVTLGGLFFLSGAGTAPLPVRVHLVGSLLVALAVAFATVPEAPFGIMEPVFPLALTALWAARHGVFPTRRGRETG